MDYRIISNQGRILLTTNVKSVAIRLANTRSFRGTVYVFMYGTWVGLNG